MHVDSRVSLYSYRTSSMLCPWPSTMPLSYRTEIGSLQTATLSTDLWGTLHNRSRDITTKSCDHHVMLRNPQAGDVGGAVLSASSRGALTRQLPVNIWYVQT